MYSLRERILSYTLLSPIFILNQRAKIPDDFIIPRRRVHKFVNQKSGCPKPIPSLCVNLQPVTYQLCTSFSSHQNDSNLLWENIWSRGDCKCSRVTAIFCLICTLTQRCQLCGSLPNVRAKQHGTAEEELFPFWSAWPSKNITGCWSKRPRWHLVCLLRSMVFA